MNWIVFVYLKLLVMLKVWDYNDYFFNRNVYINICKYYIISDLFDRNFGFEWSEYKGLFLD